MPKEMQEGSDENEASAVKQRHIETVILHAIAEAVKATGAREALAGLLSCRALSADACIAPSQSEAEVNAARAALAALDKLGRAAE